MNIFRIFRRNPIQDRQWRKIEEARAKHEATSDLERRLTIQKANNLAKVLGVPTVDERVKQKLGGAQ